MFPTFISILDIQSWWEVPSIAHFCSLFRAAFNLLDFDIEDLEEALLTDGTEETSWLQELIVRLLSGCLANNDISTFNYQMFLRRLFRQKCQEHGRYNPFNTDIDFQFLPLRTKVEILQALCDFRLDADDVLDHLKNLEADSLRVEPLGYDDNESAYWYFYGTRLYREDFTCRNKRKVRAEWQVICFTEHDWYQLARKFRKSGSKAERQLYRTLSENFLPELPRLFQEKEVLHRKRLLEWLPRRTRLDSKRQQQQQVTKQSIIPEQPSQQEPTEQSKEPVAKESEKADTIKDRTTQAEDQEEEEEVESTEEHTDLRTSPRKRHEHRGKKRKDTGGGGKPEVKRHAAVMAERRRQRELRSLNRDKIRKQETGHTPQAHTGKPEEKSTGGGKTAKGSMPGATTVGRQTNNSLASATGQIVIQSVSNPNRKKLKTSQVFRQTDEDLQTGMYKILQAIKGHGDAWPFADPVDEEYAPNYYSIIRRPMDLQRMEDKLDSGMYQSYNKFRQDFQLIVDNCRLYNGADNEYTGMVDKLQKEFERATDRYLDQISSSDEEIAVEFQETKDRTNATTAPAATPAATANTPSGPQAKRKKTTDNSAPTAAKRKPTSIAHTADKRERSPSPVESTAKRRSEPEKETKPVQKITRGKTQAATNKSLKNAKNDTTKNVGKPTKRAVKKVQTPSPVRSRTRSPKSPSWPPSSPEPVVASHNADNSSDEGTTVGKAKGKHKYWKEVFKDKKSVEKEVKPVKEPPAAKIKDPPPPAKVKEPASKPKDKNIKLKETIEKLKAKNELALSDDGVLRAKNKDDKPKEKLPKLLEKEPTKEKIEKVSKEPTKEKIEKGGKKPTTGAKNKPKATVKEPGKTKNSKCEYDFDEEENSTMDSAVSDGKKTAKKPVGAPGVKKAAVKNVADIDALSAATEQTLKDINKWLDDTPRFSEFSSASNSPSHFISAEEQDPVGAKIELEYRKTLKMEKPLAPQRPKDGQKDPFKRRSSKDPSKLHRRREIQRTIERLQPGKSKGNLLSNMQNANKPEELFPLGPLAKLRESKNSLVVKQDESAPKLSLGTVLDSFGQQHNFSEDAEVVKEADSVSVKDENTNCSTSVKLDPPSTTEVKSTEVVKVKKEDEVTSDTTPEPVAEKKEVKSENKATPNLSAWFKAFGAPKVQPVVKKKADNDEDKKETVDNSSSAEGPSRPQPDNKTLPTTTTTTPAAAAVISAEDSRKVISPEPESQPTPRQRRGSTGSSISERSSFSQDLDSSPRMTIDERIGAYPAPYPSPLHRSPASASPVMASPEPQRPYPTLNGSIRVGFYQDTVSTKSSPDKSCSPRDQPHSPYQHYSVAEHVYTPPNTTAAAAVVGGFSYTNPPYYAHNPSINHSPPSHATSTNHSPPIYADRPNPAPYYDTTKPLTDQYNAKVPPAPPTMGYQGQEEPVNSPEPVRTAMDTTANISEYRQQIKQPTMFPVKKRLYSEMEQQQQQQQLDEQDMTMDQSTSQLQPTNRNIEMGLMTGRQLNLTAQPRSVQPQAQLGSPALQDKQFMPADSQQQQQQPSAYARPDSRGLALNKPYEGQMDLTHLHHGTTHLHHSTTHQHHHHQPPAVATSRELELNMQLPNQSLPMRQMNYPTTTANVYSHSLTAHDTSNAYSLLDMSANTSREQEERKLTNMGYLAPNAPSPQSYYTNRPPSRPADVQQPGQVSATPQAEHMNLSMRYPDSRMSMNYHRPSPMEVSRPDTGQSNLPMTSVPNSEMLQVPQVSRSTPQGMTATNYKPEMTIPRPTFNAPAAAAAAGGLSMDQSLGLRGNLANLSHIVDRYPTGLQTSTPYYTSEKALPTPHMFAAAAAKSNPTVTSSLPMFSQPNMVGISSYGQSQSVYTRTMSDLQSSTMSTAQQQQHHHQQLQQAQQQVQQQQQQQIQQQQPEKKPSKKRKTKQQAQVSSAASDVPMSNPSVAPPAQQGFQAYAELKNSEPSAISLKTASVVPGSAFNFGPTPPGLGLYGDKDGYPGFLDDYRPATNYYMAAAAAAHRGSQQEPNVVVDKPQVRPAHQQSPAPPPAAAAAFPFLGHPQPRAPAYPSLPSPFMNPHHQSPLMDPNSPLYQQYLHSAGAVLHQGLLAPPTGYPPGYHPALSSMRQPYDSMTRPSWL